MSGITFLLRCLLLSALFFIAACANGVRTTDTFNAQDPIWQGRLSVRVRGENSQSFSAQFTLQGSPSKGQLTLYTPLGSTVAQVQWSEKGVLLKGQGDPRSFETLAALTQSLTGAELPIGDLFVWLEGGPMTAPGWQVERADLDAGLLTARSDGTASSIELKLVLER